MSRGARLSPRARGAVAMVAVSLLTSAVTGAVAAWSLDAPLRLPRLAFAIVAAVIAIAFGALVGRVVARRAAEERAAG